MTVKYGIPFLRFCILGSFCIPKTLLQLVTAAEDVPFQSIPMYTTIDDPMEEEASFLNLSSERLAYHWIPGKCPAVLFLPGFQSSMDGKKTLSLEEHCRKRGIAMCRFDYRGHGLSSGFTQELTLSSWIEDATTILNDIVGNHRQVILVGSSMGVWIACHLAARYPERIVGLVGLAAAPDCFEYFYQKLSRTKQRRWEDEGVLAFPTIYNDGTPYLLSWKLVEDARKYWNVLQSDEQEIGIRCPVRLFHGKCDVDIDWEQSVRLRKRLVGTGASDVVTLFLTEDGDHRLSRPEDLSRMCVAVDQLIGICGVEHECG